MHRVVAVCFVVSVFFSVTPGFAQEPAGPAAEEGAEESIADAQDEPGERRSRLRFSLGYWAGPEDADYIEHLRDDLTFAGLSPRSLIDNPGPKPTEATPVALEFWTPLQVGDLSLRLEHYVTGTSYRDGSGLTTGGTLFFFNHDRYRRERLHIFLGYRLGFLEDRLHVTPRLGLRRYGETSDLGLAGVQPDFVQLIAQVRDVNGEGTVAGLDLEYLLLEDLSVLGTYARSVGPIDGDMNLASLNAAAARSVFGSATSLSYAGAVADHLHIWRSWSLALSYRVFEGVRIAAGYRKETISVRYPDYFTFSAALGGGFIEISPTELVTNRISYDQAKLSEKKGVFLEASYELGL